MDDKKCKNYIEKVKFYDKNSKKELKNDNFGHCFAKKDVESCYCDGNLGKCDLKAKKDNNNVRYENTADMYIDAHKVGNENVIYLAPGTKYTYNFYTGFSHSNDDRDINSFMELMWRRFVEM